MIIIKNIISYLYINYLYKFPINRGKNFLARVLTKIFGTFIVKTKDGISLEIFLSSPMDTSYYAFNFNNLILSEINNLNERNIFLDIGANIGYYSIVASKKVGESGRVYSFEPSAREFKRLLKNIELNQCSNIVPLNIALSNTTDEINFSIANGHTGLNSFIISEKSVPKTVQIAQTLTLDTLLNLKNRTIDLAKIDVEGAELNVLIGMEGILKAKTIKRIIMEITPKFFNCFNYTKDDVYRLLYRYGYKSLINSSSDQFDELFVLSDNDKISEK